MHSVDRWKMTSKSFSRVVTTISVSMGKGLDMEVLTKECTVCRMHEKDKDSLKH